MGLHLKKLSCPFIVHEIARTCHISKNLLLRCKSFVLTSSFWPKDDHLPRLQKGFWCWFVQGFIRVGNENGHVLYLSRSNWITSTSLTVSAFTSKTVRKFTTSNYQPILFSKVHNFFVKKYFSSNVTSKYYFQYLKLPVILNMEVIFLFPKSNGQGSDNVIDGITFNFLSFQAKVFFF